MGYLLLLHQIPSHQINVEKSVFFNFINVAVFITITVNDGQKLTSKFFTIFVEAWEASSMPATLNGATLVDLPLFLD